MNPGSALTPFRWHFSADERDACWTAALRACGVRKCNPTPVSASERDQTYYEWIGRLGELAFARLHDLPITHAIRVCRGDDGGVDNILYGHEVDVKTRDRGIHFYMPLKTYEDRGLRAEIYPLMVTSGENAWAEFAGWLTADEIDVYHEEVTLAGRIPSILVKSERLGRPEALLPFVRDHQIRESRG